MRQNIEPSIVWINANTRIVHLPASNAHCLKSLTDAQQIKPVFLCDLDIESSINLLRHSSLGIEVARTKAALSQGVGKSGVPRRQVDSTTQTSRTPSLYSQLLLPIRPKTA